MHIDKSFGTGRFEPFKGNDNAIRRAANWFRATLFGDEDAEKRCERGWSYPVIRSQAEYVNTIGGFVVPETIEAEIASYRDAVGVFRQNADVRRMPSATHSVPRRDTGYTGSFVGEGAAIPESSATWSSVTLHHSACKLGHLLPYKGRRI